MKKLIIKDRDREKRRDVQPMHVYKNKVVINKRGFVTLKSLKKGNIFIQKIEDVVKNYSYDNIKFIHKGKTWVH